MNSAGGGITAAEGALLREAAEWRLISLLFECPSGPWKERVELLKADVHHPELRQAAEAALAEATEGMFHSLFGPGGPVPPREVSYHGGIEAGQLLSGIAAYYQAFGYRPETMEADDHISVETGFIAYLRVKEAYASTCGDSEHAILAADAARNFVKDHLSMWAVPMVRALETAAPHYLVLVGKLLQARLGTE